MGNQIGYEAMALKPLEKKAILESWMSLRKQLSVCGQSVITILLEDYPGHLQYFPVKYKGNPDLAETLGLKLMREISRVVSNLDAISEIVVYLKDIAQIHHQLNISKAAFDDMRHSFLKMVHRHLGSHKHCRIYLHCWDKLLRLVNKIVIDLMDELEKKSHKTSVKDEGERSSRVIQNTPKYEPPKRQHAASRKFKNTDMSN